MAKAFPDDMDLVTGDIDRGVAYVNGEFRPIQEANIWVMDTGFFAGTAVFDVLSGYRGYVLRMEAHIDRFFRSMQAVRIRPPFGKGELKDLLLELVRRSGLRDAYICCVATGGRRGAGRLDTWRPTIILYAVPFISVVPPHLIETGGKLRISSIRNLPSQCVDPKIKTYNRMHSYLAQLEAIDAGDDEVVMLDMEGYVSEGRGSNVFAVKRGAIYTPREHVLQGITRETIFEMAEREGIPAHEATMTPYDLYTADEVFLATTAGGVMPFIQVDGRVIGDGRPGEITEHLRQLYWQVHTDPRWATPVY
ncbi:MAG: aminotransferase class IV [Dehalococcoidales bacterium]|nr:aminotransferase class IV [Dehalococcoidales bacterium]